MLRSAEPAILKPTEHIVNSQTSGAYLICQSQKVGGGGSGGAIISLFKSSAAGFVSNELQH